MEQKVRCGVGDRSDQGYVSEIKFILELAYWKVNEEFQSGMIE